MDAVEFLKERSRMCNAQNGCHMTCPISAECCEYFINHNYSSIIAEKIITFVEQWAKEHPIKTRQSKFVEEFPNVLCDNGLIAIDPCFIDQEIGENCCNYCDKCRKEYWLQEVE